MMTREWFIGEVFLKGFGNLAARSDVRAKDPLNLIR